MTPLGVDEERDEYEFESDGDVDDIVNHATARVVSPTDRGEHVAPLDTRATLYSGLGLSCRTHLAQKPMAASSAIRTFRPGSPKLPYCRSPARNSGLHWGSGDSLL